MKTVKRVLSIDVRPRKIGYAVFESPTRLLNWGVKLIPSPERTIFVLSRLLAVAQPSAVVMGDHAAEGRRVTALLIKKTLRHRAMPLTLVSDKQIKKLFRDYGATTKYEIATALAKSFPELAWQLPHPRRPWETEHWHMPIFDATALGVVHIGLRVDPEAVTDLLSS
jgi:hypothetical protein